MKGKAKAKEPCGVSKFFGELADRTSLAAGRASTFIIAAGTVIVWAISGPLFGFSDMWQLVINTGTTIVTFLMVFLIQNSQNRDSAAIQVKLDELIRVGAARNGRGAADGWVKFRDRKKLIGSDLIHRLKPARGTVTFRPKPARGSGER
jgi:hypothetical protein